MEKYPLITTGTDIKVTPAGDIAVIEVNGINSGWQGARLVDPRIKHSRSSVLMALDRYFKHGANLEMFFDASGDNRLLDQTIKATQARLGRFAFDARAAEQDFETASVYYENGQHHDIWAGGWAGEINMDQHMGTSERSNYNNAVETGKGVAVVEELFKEWSACNGSSWSDLSIINWALDTKYGCGFIFKIHDIAKAKPFLDYFWANYLRFPQCANLKMARSIRVKSDKVAYYAMDPRYSVIYDKDRLENDGLEMMQRNSSATEELLDNKLAQKRIIPKENQAPFMVWNGDFEEVFQFMMALIKSSSPLVDTKYAPFIVIKGLTGAHGDNVRVFKLNDIPTIRFFLELYKPGLLLIEGFVPSKQIPGPSGLPHDGCVRLLQDRLQLPHESDSIFEVGYIRLSPEHWRGPDSTEMACKANLTSGIKGAMAVGINAAFDEEKFNEMQKIGHRISRAVFMATAQSYQENAGPQQNLVPEILPTMQEIKPTEVAEAEEQQRKLEEWKRAQEEHRRAMEREKEERIIRTQKPRAKDPDTRWDSLAKAIEMDDPQAIEATVCNMLFAQDTLPPQTAISSASERGRKSTNTVHVTTRIHNTGVRIVVSPQSTTCQIFPSGSNVSFKHPKTNDPVFSLQEMREFISTVDEKTLRSCIAFVNKANKRGTRRFFF